jgi:hypothetical protein
MVDYTGNIEESDGVWVGYYLSTTPFEYIGNCECFIAKVVVVQVCQHLLKMILNNVKALLYCFESFVSNLVLFDQSHNLICT